MADKRIYVIAGPNGAGKTTFAMRLLRDAAMGVPFVNADLIAAGLSPLDRGKGAALAAGRLMLLEINRLVAMGSSFAFETTLAGRGYLRYIDCWRQDGYWVILVFLRLNSAEDAVRRVHERFRKGGHWVDEDVVGRRFDAGLRNLYEHYIDRVDEWRVLDNSRLVPVLIEQGAY